jgi:hypothetical protein
MKYTSKVEANKCLTNDKRVSMFLVWMCIAGVRP